MAKTDNFTDYLTDIANAIREKTGGDELINAQDFSNKIRSIEGGYNKNYIVLELSENDIFPYLPDYFALKYNIIVVDFPPNWSHFEGTSLYFPDKFDASQGGVFQVTYYDKLHIEWKLFSTATNEIYQYNENTGIWIKYLNSDDFEILSNTITNIEQLNPIGCKSQVLSDIQKKQARTNINALGTNPNELEVKTVDDTGKPFTGEFNGWTIKGTANNEFANTLRIADGPGLYLVSINGSGLGLLSFYEDTSAPVTVYSFCCPFSIDCIIQGVYYHYANGTSRWSAQYSKSSAQLKDTEIMMIAYKKLV